MKNLKNLFAILVFMIISTSLVFAQNDSYIDKSYTLRELQDSIQKILIKTKTPGAGIVMLSGDNVILLKGLGKADIENDIDVNENTMFRLGSVSKLFVGLAILKLQEEGILNLKDTVSNLIPDLKIINTWEDQYPIRIENLLEHTAGLSDYSIAELGSNDPKPKTLKESLEYYPKARVAKYVPGTRTQYSNLSTSIAAYVVEKVSGMTYEDYVSKHFFKPMGIENMTFRYTEQFKKRGAKGYDNGIPLDLDYLHSLYRPSTALNASPKDIAKMLSFFIKRGKINDTQIISDSSLQRMERKESFFISESVMFKGYCLGNQTTRYKNFVYHGHGGRVPGYNSNFVYLPEYNVGYAIMINGDNQDVINRISRFIMEYQTKDLPQETVKLKKIVHKSTDDISGYYIAVNFKFELLKFFKKFKSIKKIWYEGDTLYSKIALRQFPSKYYPIGNNEFRSEFTNKIRLVQIKDPIEGQVIYDYGRMLKKISPVYFYILLVIFWSLFIIPVTISIFAGLRLLIYLFGKEKNKKALWISFWPFITILFFIAIGVVFKMSIHTDIDNFLLLGNITPLSILIFIGTIGFALASLWTVYYIYKNRNIKISKIFLYHSALAAIFNIVFTIYFFSNGLIGIITWI